MRQHECELFGKVLAEKVYNLAEKTSAALMNKIDRLVFQTILTAEARAAKPTTKSSAKSSTKGKTLK